LSWLLAQEARGAAKMLRQGVTQLKQAPAEPATSVETTLDTLDDAIGKLSELQSGAPGKAARRGRIDLAALLYELAPNARIAIEPGAGTEVFGEENELKRMLYVLVSQASAGSASPSDDTAPEVQIRREDHWVRISVDLGPDTAATGELERRWLSRMAIRHGGRLELEGGTQSVLLPADGASDQREVVELRKELEQAQQLGEAYARELAQVFSAGELPDERVSLHAPDHGAERFELLVAGSSALWRSFRELDEALKADAALAEKALGDDAELCGRLNRRAAAVHELALGLSRLAECPLAESVERVEPRELAKRALQASEARAARSGVELVLDAEPCPPLSVRPKAFELLLKTLIDHAISATPRDGRVTLRLAPLPNGVDVRVQDGGPVVPDAARSDVLRRRVDPTALGRPAGLSLLGAHTLAAYLGGDLALRESTEGRAETQVVIGGTV
jgi:signal transduction histidine kinase